MAENPQLPKKSLDDYMLSKEFYDRELLNTLRNPDLSLLPTPADHYKHKLPADKRPPIA